MARTASIPDVAVSETAHVSALVSFGALACVLFAIFAVAVYLRKKAERDGIYRKYRLPGDSAGKCVSASPSSRARE